MANFSKKHRKRSVEAEQIYITLVLYIELHEKKSAFGAKYCFSVVRTGGFQDGRGLCREEGRTAL